MGSRYGVKIRKRINTVMTLQRAKHACPKCGKASVKRHGYAKWECKSCGAVFAGGAYTPETMVGASARKTLSSAKKTD
ncbi:MAG: 50S ribosomal protein L37ae [Candidatus Micrarchaeia archaeon]|jgi:large subunit ribosomal protein L37Ae